RGFCRSCFPSPMAPVWRGQIIFKKHKEAAALLNPPRAGEVLHYRNLGSHADLPMERGKLQNGILLQDVAAGVRREYTTDPVSPAVHVIRFERQQQRFRKALFGHTPR